MDTLFNEKELLCIKAAVNLSLATQDFWNNEYVISEPTGSPKGLNLDTLEMLRLKLEAIG